MKTTEITMKSFNIIFGAEHERRERRFALTYLYPGFRFSFHNRAGLFLEDILEFGNKCDDFGVRVIGLETIFDSEYNLFIEAYEQYVDDYNIDWLYKAAAFLKENGIEKHLIPYLDISKEILDKYLLDD